MPPNTRTLKGQSYSTKRWANLAWPKGSKLSGFSNDRYLLENEKFRLYYTAEGEEAHNFIVVVEDNFGNSYELEFDFNNRNVKDEGIVSVVPIGNFKPLLR